jgi:hypothetical protein
LEKQLIQHEERSKLHAHATAEPILSVFLARWKQTRGVPWAETDQFSPRALCFDAKSKIFLRLKLRDGGSMLQKIYH